MADEVTRRAPRFGRGWLEAAQSRASARRNILLEQDESRRLYEDMQSAIARATELLGPDDPHLTSLVVNWVPWAGAWSSCEERLRQALARAPHLPALKGTLGSLLVHSGRLTEGLELFRDAQKQEPLRAILSIAYGSCLSALERQEEAFAVFEAILRRWPDHAFTWRSLVTGAARDGRWGVVEKWTTPASIAKFRKDPAAVEATLGAIEMHRNPENQGRARLLQRIADGVDRAGRVRMIDLTEAAQFCDAGAIHDLADRASFVHLTDPLAGYDPDDWGAQMLFSAQAKRLREDKRFVRLCARLGLVEHWIDIGRWPDCADRTSYDFRSEARRVSNVPLG
jgi:tetratricopeptide (TPR) repeat protein